MKYIFAAAVGCFQIFTIINAGGDSFIANSTVTPITQQTTQTTSTSTDDEVFDNFKIKYKKHYATQEQEKQAKITLLERIAKINAHNLRYDQGLVSYMLGLWENSDVSLKDIKRPSVVPTKSKLLRSVKEPATEEQLKSIIDNHGGVPAIMDIADNSFLSYKSGIYKCENTELNLQLKVFIIGYGTENNVDYWLCKNRDWNTSFGESGNFKIVRRNSPCTVELRM